jgi:hypothetical protein
MEHIAEFLRTIMFFLLVLHPASERQYKPGFHPVD